MFCEKCGNAVASKSLICHVCGNPLGQGKTKCTQYSASKSRSALVHFFMVLGSTIVILMLVAVALFIISTYHNYRSKERMGRVRTEIALISGALQGHKLDMGRYPSQQEGLRALIENTRKDPRWDGPYLQSAVVPKDPWGHEYIYIYIKNGAYDEFEVISYGADGVPGGSGENADVSSN